MSYINRDALIKKIFPYDGVDKASYVLHAKAVFDAINEAPTADVAEVRHGYWTDCDWVGYDVHSECVHYPIAAVRCSNCRHAFKKENLSSLKYCPNCGARMDAERSEQ